MKSPVLGLNGCSSLGDALWLTPTLRACNEPIVQMHIGLQEDWVAPIFNDLAKVEFVENPAQRIYLIENNNIKSHAAERCFKSFFGRDEESETGYLPSIFLTEAEIINATNLLQSFENPIILINDNSGSSDSSNKRSQYVRPPVWLMQLICTALKSSGYTPIQFGKIEESKFTPLKGAKYFRGLPVRMIAAIYNVVGKMFSGDTGDYHLMLSVGGKSITLHPNENASIGYEYWDLHYDLSKEEKENQRVLYFNFNDFNHDKFIQALKFLETGEK